MMDQLFFTALPWQVRMISVDLRIILENFENMLLVVTKRFRVARVVAVVVKTVR